MVKHKNCVFFVLFYLCLVKHGEVQGHFDRSIVKIWHSGRETSRTGIEGDLPRSSSSCRPVHAASDVCIRLCSQTPGILYVHVCRKYLNICI
jgi:hypothetical protein